MAIAIAHGVADPPPRSLEGLHVCMLREYNYVNDARARKEARALTDAGARVTLVGVGVEVPQDLHDAGYEVRLVVPRFKQPRLGREDVWWPLRVATNLTYTRARLWWHQQDVRTRRRRFVFENELVAETLALNPDIIHANNVYALPAAIRVKETTGARVVYSCLDLFQEIEWVTDRKLREFMRIAEERYIGCADAVTTVSEPLADVLQSRYGIARPTVIYRGPWNVVESATAAHEPVRLLFQGYFAPDRNLIALIEAMRHFVGKATLTLQGAGGIETELRRQVEASGLTGVVSFIPMAAPLETVSAAAEFDIGIVCYRDEHLNMRVAVPNKLMDYLGAGLAVAVSDLPVLRNVLGGTGAAVFIDPSAPGSIAEGLAEIIDDRERITTMKAAAREVALRYAWPVQAQKMIVLYERVMEGGSRGTQRH